MVSTDLLHSCTAFNGCHCYQSDCSLACVQVQGKVTGSFQSGYLADVTVNGFTYQAVLFSPYLALNTPAHTFVQPAVSSRAQSGGNADDANPLPVLPEDNAAVQQHSEHPRLLAAKQEDSVVDADQAHMSAVPNVDYHMVSATPSGPDLHA